MIKNEAQFKRVAERIEELREEIRKLQGIYTRQELKFWSSAIEDEEKQLLNEQAEYNRLKDLPFEEAVESVLQEPFLFENIGELLAKLRIAAKLTQEEMADRLGWQQANVSRFENENYSSQTVKKISEYVGALGIWLYVTPSLSEKRRKSDRERSTNLFRNPIQQTPSGIIPLNVFGDTTTASTNTPHISSTDPMRGSIYQQSFQKESTKVSSSSLIHP